jgi:hypothetical protein
MCRAELKREEADAAGREGNQWVKNLNHDGKRLVSFVICVA